MYLNLELELMKAKITKTKISKDLKRSISTISAKISGKQPIHLEEAIKIRNLYFPQLDLLYLFQKEDE